MKLHHILPLAALLSLPATAQDNLHTSYFMQSSVHKHEMNPALLDTAYV